MRDYKVIGVWLNPEDVMRLKILCGAYQLSQSALVRQMITSAWEQSGEFSSIRIKRIIDKGVKLNFDHLIKMRIKD